MPTKVEKDAITGRETTGHEWDGLRELDTPLPNIGPVSKRMLASAGIKSIETLRRLGSIEAYRRVRAHDPRASLNLLWALEGALTGRPWEDVARNDRLSLMLQLENRS